MQRVGKQEIIRGNLQAMELVCYPRRFIGMRGSGVERIQDELSAVTATRSAYLPE
jgi:hypothetical protein